MEHEIFRYLVNIAVALCVSIINILIKVCFNLLSRFERYKSITHLNGAIMRKTFISTFINMGLLYLLINANFRSSGFIRSLASALPGGKKYFFNGDYADLNRDWYSKVAISIIVLSITNLISLVVGAVITEFINFIKRKYFAKRQVLQHDMNALMDGKEFTIATKYSTTLALIFVTIVYFGPVPLLIMICAMYLATNYWLDKFIFVKLGKIPPYTGPSMHISVLRYLPIAIMMHCIFSMWAYGSPKVYPEGFHTDGTNAAGQVIYRPDDRNFGERLTNKNSIIFFILFILFVIGYIFENIIQGVIYKFIYKSSYTINTQQKSFKEAESEMKEWTVTSYEPGENIKYDKVLKAILDVAEINPDLNDSEEEKKEPPKQRKMPREEHKEPIQQEEVSKAISDVDLLEEDQLPPIAANKKRDEIVTPPYKEDNAQRHMKRAIMKDELAQRKLENKKQSEINPSNAKQPQEKINEVKEIRKEEKQESSPPRFDKVEEIHNREVLHTPTPVDDKDEEEALNAEVID